MQESAKNLNILIRRYLQSLQKDQSFKEICISQKPATQICSYFIKLYTHGLMLVDQFQKLIESVLDKLAELAHITQFERSGHILPLFQYVIRKNQHRWISPAFCPIAANVAQDPYYQSVKLGNILNDETKYLNKSQFNQNLKQIVNGDIRLTNQDCIFCSEIFFKDFEIRNNNPSFPCVIGLKESDYTDYIFQTTVCAVCNMGGGAIVIGAQIIKGKLVALGNIFSNLYELQKKESQIALSMSCIKPEFSFDIKSVLVHTNLFKQSEPTLQINRYCLIISLKPVNIYKKYYLEINQKGYHPVYKTYELQNMIPKRVQYDLDGKQNIYTMAMKRYSLKKINKNSHYGIKCCQSYLFPSKICRDWIAINGQKLNEINQKVKTLEGQLELKYKYVSLFALSSKKKDNLVQDMVSLLKAKKKLIDVEKPYASTFKTGVRSIWIITHNENHQTIKKCIKESDNSGAFLLQPVSQTFHIDQAKLTPQISKKFQMQFISMFKNGYQAKKLNIGNQLNICFKFDNLAQTIYAYMIFDSLQLRPNFPKEKEIQLS